MKKGIIILLLALLVSGFAFAEVTKFEGYAQADYAVGLNRGDEFGFKNSQEIKFEFLFEFATADKDKAEHETDFWAEVAASASAGYINDLYILSVLVTKANIHIKDFTINILGPAGPYDYAKSFTLNSLGDSIFDYANNKELQFAFEIGHGIEIQYQDYSVSVAQYKTKAKDATAPTLGPIIYMTAEEWAAAAQDYYAVIKWTPDNGVYVAAKIDGTDAKPENLWAYAGIQTKTFEFGEGITFKAAVNALAQGDKDAQGKYVLRKNAGIAAKFKYTADKVTADVAADVEYGQATLNADILLTGGYDFVSGGIYFGLSKARGVDAEKVLEAFVKAAIPSGDYTVNFYAEADRLFRVAKNGRDASHFNVTWAGFTVKADTTIDKFTLGAFFNYNQIVDTVKIEGVSTDFYGMDFGADVAYDAEKYTVKGGVALAFLDYQAPEPGARVEIRPYAVKPHASISTDKVVENCTLSLGWSDARFVVFPEAGNGYKKLFMDNGKITATAKIEF